MTEINIATTHDDRMGINRINATTPDPAVLARFARLITGGGVVVFPTQCLYGLGADALNAGAVARLFSIKQRRPVKPILILIGRRHQPDTLVTEISPAARTLMETFWPGNLTLVFKARSHLPEVLTAGTGTIGIRMAGHPVAQALLEFLEQPITGTSANLADQEGCSDIANLPKTIMSSVDGVLDAGPLKGGSGSTVVNVATPTVRILREGVIAAAAVAAALGLSAEALAAA